MKFNLGLVRHNVDAFWKFIELGGDKLIIFSLKSSIQKLVIKATFLVCITCQMDKAITGKILFLP